MTKRICFFHKIDLDGQCSGAIFKRVAKLKKWDNIKLIPYNYGDKIDVEELRNAEVYFLDCTPSPIETLAEVICSVASKVVVCDHHRTALQSEAFKKFLAESGNSREGAAGCLLAWEYWADVLGEVPTVVKYLSDYDCWHNEDVKYWENVILPFQAGMKSRHSDPMKEENDKFWDWLFQNDKEVLADILVVGTVLLRSEKKRLAGLAKVNSFEAIVFGDKKAICMNGCTRNSQAFDAVWNPEKHDLMVVWLQQPNQGKNKLESVVSLYSTKPGIVCGELAKKMGGGGHPGAAGFKCDFVQFENGYLNFLVSEESK